MKNAVTKTHLMPMLAKAGATRGVACALSGTGTTGLWAIDFRAVMPSIGIDQTQVKVT